MKNKDGMESPILDTDLVGVDAQPFEDKVDPRRQPIFSPSNFLVSQPKLDRFIARGPPLVLEAKDQRVCQHNEVHPGIVVGQLQHRKKIAYAHSRDLLVKVRNIIICFRPDGWMGEHRVGIIRELERSTSMATYSEQLQQIANRYMRRPA